MRTDGEQPVAAGPPGEEDPNLPQDPNDPTARPQHCVQVDWPVLGMWMNLDHKPSEYHGRKSWMGRLLQHGRDGSGQYYRRNRFYDASTGRFTQEDPIGLAGGLNLYGFASGDPVTYSDPFGLTACPTAPKDSPRFNGSREDCTPEEIRSALGVVDDEGIGPIQLAIDVVPVVKGLGLLKSVVGAGLRRLGSIFAKRATAEVNELVITHSPRLARSEIDDLVADIAEHGIKDPIRYVEHNGHKFVVDGHHRLIAARRLRVKEVPVEQVSLPYRGYRTINDLEFQP